MTTHANNRYPSKNVTDLFDGGFKVPNYIEKKPIVDQNNLKVLKALQKLKAPPGHFQAGKYTGLPYRKVVREDPSYVNWILTSCTSPKFQEDAEALLDILCSSVKEEEEEVKMDESYE